MVKSHIYVVVGCVVTLKTDLNIQSLENSGFTHLALALPFSQTSRTNGEINLSIDTLELVSDTPPYRKRELVVFDPISGTGRIFVDTSAIIGISLHTHRGVVTR